MSTHSHTRCDCFFVLAHVVEKQTAVEVTGLLQTTMGAKEPWHKTNIWPRAGQSARAFCGAAHPSLTDASEESSDVVKQSTGTSNL